MTVEVERTCSNLESWGGGLHYLYRLVAKNYSFPPQLKQKISSDNLSGIGSRDSKELLEHPVSFHERFSLESCS